MRTPIVGRSCSTIQSTTKAAPSCAASIAKVGRSTPRCAVATASESTIVTPNAPPV